MKMTVNMDMDTPGRRFILDLLAKSVAKIEAADKEIKTKAIDTKPKNAEIKEDKCATDKTITIKDLYRRPRKSSVPQSLLSVCKFIFSQNISVSQLNCAYTGNCVPRSKEERNNLRKLFGASFGKHSEGECKILEERFASLVESKVVMDRAEFCSDLVRYCSEESSARCVRNIVGLYVGQDIPNKLAAAHISRIIKLVLRAERKKENALIGDTAELENTNENADFIVIGDSTEIEDTAEKRDTTEQRYAVEEKVPAEKRAKGKITADNKDTSEKRNTAKKRDTAKKKDPADKRDTTGKADAVVKRNFHEKINSIDKRDSVEKRNIVDERDLTGESDDTEKRMERKDVSEILINAENKDNTEKGYITEKTNAHKNKDSADKKDTEKIHISEISVTAEERYNAEKSETEDRRNSPDKSFSVEIGDNAEKKDAMNIGDTEKKYATEKQVTAEILNIAEQIEISSIENKKREVALTSQITGDRETKILQENMHFSFETEQSKATWFSTYQRQANGTEFLFYPTPFPAPFLLPYEIPSDKLDTHLNQIKNSFQVNNPLSSILGSEELSSFSENLVDPDVLNYFKDDEAITVPNILSSDPLGMFNKCSICSSCSSTSLFNLGKSRQLKRKSLIHPQTNQNKRMRATKGK